MNIIYCHDNRLNNLLERSKESFLFHNPDAKFFEITEDKQNLLKDFTEELCGFKHVSKACFLRLLIPKVFPELDRALYIDADTLCLGDISELYNTDFDNNYLIACRGHKHSDSQAKQLGLPYYINSGVLLYNIPLMNENKYFDELKEKWRGCLGKQEPFSADETIINWVFHNKIKLTNEKFNYIYNRTYGLRAVEKPVIIHFCGKNKTKMFNYTYV